MKFSFKESRNGRVKRLFVPMSTFSFSAFAVKIKFHQPAPRWPVAVDLKLNGQANRIIAGAV